MRGLGVLTGQIRFGDCIVEFGCLIGLPIINDEALKNIDFVQTPYLYRVEFHSSFLIILTVPSLWQLDQCW